MDEVRLSEVLSEFARTLLTDLPIQKILDHFVERIVTILPISAAGVTLITPSTDPRYIAASDGSALRFEQLQTELADGPCLASYQSMRPVAVPDLREENEFARFSVRALQEGLVAVFAFPLLDGDRCLGALDLYRTSAGALDEADTAAAQTLADVATSYLLNAQRREDLEVASRLARDTSLHDSLTGLPNRTLFMERLAHAIGKSARTDTLVAVLFADLDRFKQVNDSFGHHVGDELLVAVGARLSSVLRPGDTLSRLAGDEFAIVCEDITEVGQAHQVAERVGTAVAKPFQLSSTELIVTMSVGIATVSHAVAQAKAIAGRPPSGGPSRAEPRLTPEEAAAAAEGLVREADLAMYQIKKAGGNGRGATDVHELRINVGRLDLARDLHGAIERGELRTAYQPIVSVAGNRVTGVEALLRWDHPQLGAITPAVFIPLAERAGLIVKVGRDVLAQACRTRNVLASRGFLGEEDGVGFGVAVNVSVHQLMSAGFCSSVEEVLTETGTPPETVTLEVTESAFIRDYRRGREVLVALRELGVLIALDDFGAGGSSLTHLRDFPLDIVKIDRTFVHDLVPGSTCYHIVEAVITLAHRLGMRTIAEGVETPAQFASLVALGCDSYQGYMFSPAVPPDQLESLLRPDGAAGPAPSGSTPTGAHGEPVACTTVV